jgi:DnaJ-class molecular chaperone
MEIRDEDLTIDACMRCEGSGRAWDKPEGTRGYRQTITCPDCKGRGVKLTETGAKLFDFVREAVRRSR